MGEDYSFMALRDRAKKAEARVATLERERDQLRDLLVSAEGYALVSGADRPFACMFVEDSPLCAVIERAGCYPRNARREHPGRFALNPPPPESHDQGGE